MDNSQFRELYQLETDTAADMVVRSDNHAHQSETVSFGPVWPTSKFANALDVVNYYKPNLKSHLYLPENSILNSQGKLKPHMGGESTFRGGSTNNDKQGNTQTNNHSFDHMSAGEYDDSDKATVVPEGRSKGLFEVPFDVYSMPRLIAPFKGFSKIVTPRAVRLMSFTETEEGKLTCKLDKNSLRILQKQVGDLNVVTVSFVGDPKSGKSFLASLLVGKDNVSFNMSESYIDPNKMMTGGAVWAYVAVYQEKNAYVFLDFEGLEHSERSRERMLLFAFATSNLVFCNVKYSLMTGIHNSVNAMVHLTKKQVVNESLGDHDLGDEEENEFMQMFKNRGSRMLTRSYDTQNFNELASNTVDTYDHAWEKRALWKAPIVQFVFRDCSGFVKCIDDRIFTPETLVEQGLFVNYLDLFDTTEKDPNYKNEMLDSFEVFTNRKYLSLPHPILSTHPYREHEYAETEGLNLTEFFVKLISSDRNDLRNLTSFGYDDFTLNANLSAIFYEKLDQLKSLVYHDTLNYAMAHTQLNGRMLGEYLKKLANSFNTRNTFKVEDLNEVLSSVFLGENSNVMKQSLLQFLRHVRAKVAPKLPVDSKTLLNMVLSAKFASLNSFETSAFGTPEEYRRHLEELSETLEDLIRKLENKNKSLMTVQIANYVERREGVIMSSIISSNYTVNDLNEDLSKLKKSLNLRFTDSELVTKVLARTSQNLVRIFNNTHPETFVHNLSYSKSSSIEETFQSLNSDINSITLNLKSAPKLNGKFPSSVEPYQAVKVQVEDSKERGLNDKFDLVVEDNNLVEKSESEENEETDEEFVVLQKGLSPSSGEHAPTQQLEVNVQTSDTGEPSPSTEGDLEEDSTEDSKYDSEEQIPYAEAGKNDSRESEDSEFASSVLDQALNKGSADQEKVQEESWPTSESLISSEDQFSVENSEVMYDETPVHLGKNDEVAEIFEHDFLQEDLEQENYRLMAENEKRRESKTEVVHDKVKHEKKHSEKHTLLRKIFERSAEKYLQSKN